MFIRMQTMCDVGSKVRVYSQHYWEDVPERVVGVGPVKGDIFCSLSGSKFFLGY